MENEKLIRVEHGYAGNNEPNNYLLDVGSLRVWFSYSTVVAFNDGNGTICRINEWGPTTGKHLNAIQPNKKLRIDGEQFNKLLGVVLKKHILAL